MTVSYNMWNVKDAYKGMPLERIQEHQRNLAYSFSVCVINVNGDLNVGNIIRSACVFGAERVFVFGKRRYDKRSCVGSFNYIDISLVESSDFSRSTLNSIVEEEFGYNLVFVEQGGEELHSKNLRLPSRPCFVFGNEGEGISDKFIGENKRISIFQRGVLRSLNVANAAAIVCHSYVTSKMHD